MHNDVFGRSGHFTTSPEISQLFGEVRAIPGCVRRCAHAAGGCRGPPCMHMCQMMDAWRSRPIRCGPHAPVLGGGEGGAPACIHPCSHTCVLRCQALLLGTKGRLRCACLSACLLACPACSDGWHLGRVRLDGPGAAALAAAGGARPRARHAHGGPAARQRG